MIQYKDSKTVSINVNIFSPKKKYKLIERRSRPSGKVVMISNKYLHNYNLRNSPEYRKKYMERKRDERNYYQDRNYYSDDYEESYDNHEYSSEDADADNDLENDNQLNPIRRPMPTDFHSLKSKPAHKRNYHPRQHLKQYDVKLGDNEIRDYHGDNYDRANPIVSRDPSYLGNAYKRFRHYDNQRALRNTGNFRNTKKIDVHEDLVNKNSFDNSGFGPSFTTEFFDSLDLHPGFFDYNFPGSRDNQDRDYPSIITNNPYGNIRHKEWLTICYKRQYWTECLNYYSR